MLSYSENNIPLRVLYVEDSELDVDLVQEILYQVNNNLQFDVVSNKNDYINSITNKKFDLILSDYNIPGFGGMEALETALRICPEVPFICVSGAMSEEVAVSMLKKGAVDFLMKDRIKRLPYAVSEALMKKHIELEKETAYKLLQKNEKRYKSLFEGVPIGLFRITTSGMIVDFNSAATEILGYEQSDDLIAQLITDFWVSPDLLNQLMEDIVEKTVFSKEIQMIKKDKSIICANLKGRVLVDESGGFQYIEGSFEDITQKKMAENEILKLNVELESKVIQRTNELQETLNKLQDSNKELQTLNEQIVSDSMKIHNLNNNLIITQEELKKVIETKDKFFSIISHDLRGPFTGFISLTDLMAKDAGEISVNEIKRIAGIINSSANALFKLIDDLFMWSRTQTSSIPFSPEKLDLFDIASKTNLSLNQMASNKSIELIQNVPKGTDVFCDMNMVTTLLRNLVSNAIKFTKSEGKIIIDAVIEDSRVVVKVKDNGVGMSQKVLDSLFKIDKSRSLKGTNGETGTGLGLILCKEFAEKNNGSIWVESEEGIGTCFYFSLMLKEF